MSGVITSNGGSASKSGGSFSSAASTSGGDGGGGGAACRLLVTARTSVLSSLLLGLLPWLLLPLFCVGRRCDGARSAHAGLLLRELMLLLLRRLRSGVAGP